MYDLNFKIKCKDPIGGFQLFSVPCANLDIALALANFLHKASNEPGAPLVYVDIEVSPQKSFEDYEKKEK